MFLISIVKTNLAHHYTTINYTTGEFIDAKIFNKDIFVKEFSLNQPNRVDSVIKSPCLSVCDNTKHTLPKAVETSGGAAIIITAMEIVIYKAIGSYSVRYSVQCTVYSVQYTIHYFLLYLIGMLGVYVLNRF